MHSDNFVQVMFTLAYSSESTYLMTVFENDLQNTMAIACFNLITATNHTLILIGKFSMVSLHYSQMNVPIDKTRFLT